MQLLPGFAAIYGLHWDDIWTMPLDELIEHQEQLEHWQAVISAGATNSD